MEIKISQKEGDVTGPGITSGNCFGHRSAADVCPSSIVFDSEGQLSGQERRTVL